VLQVAPSTHFAAKARPASARAERDAEVGAALEALWKKNYSVYGRRKPTKAARRAGIDAGRDQVARLMAMRGIRGASRAKKRFTTRADPTAVRAPDLVNRNFTAARPDQLWVADFTYCSTWSGIVYAAFIIAVFSRRLGGWKAARSMTATLVVDALNMAAWTRRHSTLEDLICHTVESGQYTSIAYTERLADIGADPSIGTVGDSFDNAMAESVMGLFKTELHRNPAALADNGGPWRGLDDLEIATCAWVSWFNEERLHSELGDRTPFEIEEEYRRLAQASAASGNQTNEPLRNPGRLNVWTRDFPGNFPVTTRVIIVGEGYWLRVSTPGFATSPVNFGRWQKSFGHDLAAAARTS
jgi:transposase InsO family protein